MANTFKVVTRASVNHSALDTVYTCPGSTTTVILGMTICNRTSSATDIDVVYPVTLLGVIQIQMLMSIFLKTHRFLQTPR